MARIHARRGTVLIVALWIVIVLTGLVLVFAQTMQVEAITSANAASAIQAAAVENAAEQFVLAQIAENDQATGTPGQVLTLTDATWQAVQVGSGYFWVIRPNYGDPTMSSFGLVDEASKVNLNAAGVNLLGNLPAMPQDVPANILAWRGSTNSAASSGANDSYYMSLPNPYQLKGAPLESVEELLLMADVTPQVLYGQSPTGVANQVPPWSTNTNLPFGLDPGTAWGLFNYVTVYSRSNTSGTPSPARNNLSDRDVRQELRQVLENGGFTRQQAQSLVSSAYRSAPSAPLADAFDFYARVQNSAMTEQKFQTVFNALNRAIVGSPTGLINVNTAPREVLACLQNRSGYLTDADVSNLISYRANNNTMSQNNLSWVAQALGDVNKAVGLGRRLSSRPHQYSADIVAVSGDGRAFKRCRIVVDTLGSPTGNYNATTPIPLAIVYRKDLTQTGWPMDPSILKSLRAGNGLPPAAYSSQTGSLLQ